MNRELLQDTGWRPEEYEWYDPVPTKVEGEPNIWLLTGLCTAFPFILWFFIR